jgi:hypothetical protein
MDDEDVARFEHQHPHDAVPDPERLAAGYPVEIGRERLYEKLSSSDVHQSRLEGVQEIGERLINSSHGQ